MLQLVLGRAKTGKSTLLESRVAQRAAQGRECFLLRCERCGHVVHLDCGHLHALYEHLEAEHHFRIDPRRTILTGLCQACAGKEDPHGTQ